MKYLLNDGWSFWLSKPETALEQAQQHKKDFQAVDIPHDWLIYDSTRLYEDGTGWYRRTLLWNQEGKKAFLCFEGIYMDSRVYVNGVLAGEWKYGYSEFNLEITEFLTLGENEILVSACFQSSNSRWYSGAGIYRNVWLIATEPVYIAHNGIYISTTRAVGAGETDFTLRTEVSLGGELSVSSANGGLKLEHYLYEKGSNEKAEIPMEKLREEGEVQEFLVKNPRLWDTEQPFLYVLKTRLLLGDMVLQEEETVFGFREIRFEPETGFYLNGRNRKLNGVCEHHDLGALGAAFYPEAMRRKFAILKRMGVNAVRGAHNMMAPGYMELADEMGILLISEAFDMWEKSKNTYDYARFFKEWAARDVKSWITADRNHPSVIMWSIGNEIYDTHADAHGQDITVMLRELVRRFDPCRNAVVTICSNYMPWENAQKCAELIDVQGYNYSEKYYREHHEKHPGWVIFGSETSSLVQSRGIYHFPLAAGILADDDEQCSSLGNSTTSWGTKSMEDCICQDRDMEFSMGQFLWSGFDYIGEPTPYHTKNSYFGQIDTAGFPKDAYYVWQSAWTDYRKAPMIHIFPYWDFNEGQLIDVRVCSNAPEVELLLNGKSLGRQKLTHTPGSGKHILADYRIPYEKGMLKAVAMDERGSVIATDIQQSFGNSCSICLDADKTQLVADGRDLLFLEIGTLDEQGVRVENACDRVSVEVTGAGSLVGLDNGDSTDYDSYKGKSRRLFNGKLLAIIRAGLDSGEIHISVTGKNLKAAAMTCVCIARAEAHDADEKEKAQGVTAIEANRDFPIVTGKQDEIPVRRITLRTPEGRAFSAEKRELVVEAAIEPDTAQDREVSFRVTNDQGVPSNLVSIRQDGNRAILSAIGDGSFRLGCMSKSGTDKIRIISELEFVIEGLGQAFLDPYHFISGCLYTAVKGEASNGNERGVATARDGVTCVSYSNIDFGTLGSDCITVPVFALSDEAYDIQIWEGIPEEDGSDLLADVVYCKPSIWNVYQEDTWKLKRFVKGITTISFRVHQKIHIKGFSFLKYEKAWLTLPAASADAIYGDSFCVKEGRVEEIGNNVSLVFKDIDFGEKTAGKISICGRAAKADNTIHVRFFNGTEESKQIVEFTRCDSLQEQEFDMTPMAGKWDVTFVFLPGSNFDFDWFRFKP